MRYENVGVVDHHRGAAHVREPGLEIGNDFGFRPERSVTALSGADVAGRLLAEDGRTIQIQIGRDVLDLLGNERTPANSPVVGAKLYFDSGIASALEMTRRARGSSTEMTMAAFVRGAALVVVPA
jgi:hypothetical protein